MNNYICSACGERVEKPRVTREEGQIFMWCLECSDDYPTESE